MFDTLETQQTEASVITDTVATDTDTDTDTATPEPEAMPESPEQAEERARAQNCPDCGRVACSQYIEQERARAEQAQRDRERAEQEALRARAESAGLTELYAQRETLRVRLEDTTSDLDYLRRVTDAQRATIQDRAREIDALRSTVDNMSREHSAFKRQVIDTATEYARRHGMCDVVNQALRAMDLDPERTYEVSVTLNFTMTTNSVRDADEPDRDEIAEHISGMSYQDLTYALSEGEWTVTDISGED